VYSVDVVKTAHCLALSTRMSKMWLFYREESSAGRILC